MSKSNSSLSEIDGLNDTSLIKKGLCLEVLLLMELTDSDFLFLISWWCCTYHKPGVIFSQDHFQSSFQRDFLGSLKIITGYSLYCRIRISLVSELEPCLRCKITITQGVDKGIVRTQSSTNKNCAQIRQENLDIYFATSRVEQQRAETVRGKTWSVWGTASLPSSYSLLSF